MCIHFTLVLFSFDYRKLTQWSDLGTKWNYTRKEGASQQTNKFGDDLFTDIGLSQKKKKKLGNMRPGSVDGSQILEEENW